jgi:hypothetical protein
MAIVAVILLRWPGLGLVLLIPITFFVPFTLGTGSRSEINATVMWIGGITLLWLTSLIVNPDRRPMRLVPPQLALIGLSGVFVIALFVGQGHWLPLAGQAPLTAQIGGLAIVILSVAVFFVAAQQIPDRRWLMALVSVYLCLGALFVVGILYEPLRPYLLRMERLDKQSVLLVAGSLGVRAGCFQSAAPCLRANQPWGIGPGVRVFGLC